jgi:DNA-binding transcriptional regulator LsrR (DeoR family)
MPRFFRPKGQLNVTFVSAMGGSPTVDAPTNPNDICRALADSCGGRAASLYAPAYVENKALRDQLLSQEAVSRTIDLARRSDMAVVGIGGTDDDCTMVRSGCLSTDEVARLRSLGAVGDVLGNYVDIHGKPVASPHQDRLIALSLDDLRAVTTVVAVASEPEKSLAILGILRSGVVDTLVIDERNATAVLEAATTRPPSDRAWHDSSDKKKDGKRTVVAGNVSRRRRLGGNPI